MTLTIRDLKEAIENMDDYDTVAISMHNPGTHTTYHSGPTEIRRGLRGLEIVGVTDRKDDQ